MAKSVESVKVSKCHASFKESDTATQRHAKNNKQEI